MFPNEEEKGELHEVKSMFAKIQSMNSDTESSSYAWEREVLGSKGELECRGSWKGVRKSKF